MGSVQTSQSSPGPLMPSQVSAGSPPGNDSSKSSLRGFPVNSLQKAGVVFQKIVTTTGRQSVHSIRFFSIDTSSV